VAQWAAARGLAVQAGFLAPETTVFATGCRLEPLLRVGGIWRGVGAAELAGVFERVVAALPGATEPVRALLGRRLQAPGGVTMAPVGGGFALPHPAARIALGREAGTVALLFLREPAPLTEPPVDGEPVTRLCFFIAPSPRAHLDLLGRLSRALTRGPFREAVAREAPDGEIFAAAAAVDAAGLSRAEVAK